MREIKSHAICFCPYLTKTYRMRYDLVLKCELISQKSPCIHIMRHVFKDVYHLLKSVKQFLLVYSSTADI